MLIVGVVAWQVSITAWTMHSERVGRTLVRQFLKNRALTSPVASMPGRATGSLASCGASPDPSAAQGLLVIPRLEITAPVEQGTGDGQLDVAVGHDPYSVWPGNPGNAVLEAHDVSYFVHLAELTAGDTVRYVTPCTTYVFRVQDHTVVSQGSPVYNTPGPTITLVTCWPTDALWFTPERYLVTATEVSSTATNKSALTYQAASAPPSVPVPQALLDQGVTLATYSVPMGTMTLTGSPDPQWAQTTDPLLVQSSAVEGFIAGVKSLTENEIGWWDAIAPRVPPPVPLVGAHSPSYLSSLDVTVVATGTNPTAASLSTTMQVSGGPAPGRYAVSVAETIRGGTLVISGWTMQPT
ncbi:MAG TPA: class D sortase [Acidimicrobiales bacterium]|nr:class D sortase [Acidimicrobiales bacterium]